MFKTIFNKYKICVNTNYSNFNGGHYYSQIRSNLNKNTIDYKNIIKKSNDKFIDKLHKINENKKIKQIINDKLEMKKFQNTNLFLTLSVSICILLFSVKIFKR